MSLREMLLTKTKTKRTMFFLLCDIILISGSGWLAFALRFDNKVPLRYADTMLWFIGLTLLSTLIFFYFQKQYSISWSFVGIEDLVGLFKAVGGSFLITALIIFLLRQTYTFEGFPRSIIFISGFLVLLSTGGLRFAKRIYLQSKQKNLNTGRKTLIFGAGEAGEQLVRYIVRSPHSNYNVIGFLDDNPLKLRVSIHGIPVLGDRGQLTKIISKYAVEELIIAIPAAAAETVRELTKLARQANLQKIKILPSTRDILEEKVSLNNIRDIAIEDLLGRERINLDTSSIQQLISNKTVLITGGAGSIGSTLCEQILKFNPATLITIDFDETGIFYLEHKLKNQSPQTQKKFLIANICHENEIEKIFALYKPNLVFHAAAYKHVPLMEEHPHKAIENNIFGLRTVCLKAMQHGTERFIFISTDKAVNPSSVMGMSKRMGELICQNSNQQNHTRFISVRFGNVLDSRGNVISIFKKQIQKGGPVEVTHPEMTRYFMVTSEAVLLVMQAGAMGNGGEVFVLDMGKPIKILDLARDMIQLSGFEPDKDIPIVFTQPRPGEKLFENILTAEEGTRATHHQKILEAKLAMVDSEKLNNKLVQLEEKLSSYSREELTKLLKETVTSFY